MPRQSEQLDLLPTQGQVIPIALHTEMQRSYLEYAMSVIVGRALPDVRDGLKPVHRRILFAMHELGLTPDRPYRKCARVVGDVLGKYHPHGDQSVYDALVRLVQDFSSRYPLLAGHGNFGSVDNDPPAAMRYTETRLAAIAHEALLQEVTPQVIDFIDNFDASQMEPVVLPAQLPILLLNGATGIAVGMATNIPPHNLGEIIDGAIALIDQPDLSDTALFDLIPAPDFPTGGLILADQGIHEAYSTGKGSITIRGVINLETLSASKGKRARQALVVTELPFQVNKAAWIEKIAELVNQNKLEGITDIRDESDRTGMRVVIELKKETNPDQLIEQLYRQTALQSNFGIILLALVEREPKQLSLRQILEYFIQFRELTLTKQFDYELRQTQAKLEILAGLAIALQHLESVIPLIRAASNTAAAKQALEQQFHLTPAQSEAILAMPLRRLTSLEQQQLQAEQQQLNQRSLELGKILGERRELLKFLKKELRHLKKKHDDPRRTQIIGLKPSNTALPQPEQTLDLLPPKVSIPTVVHLSYKGYLKRLEPNSKNLLPLVSPDDLSVAVFNAQSSDSLYVFEVQGKVFRVGIDQLEISTKRGKPLITLLPDPNLQPIATLLPQAETLVMLTSQAKIKRSLLAEFAGITARGLTAIKLRPDDQLTWVGQVEPDQQLAIATSSGRILRIKADEGEIPVLSRTAQGQQVMRLRPANGEAIIATIPLDLQQFGDTELLLVSQAGYLKRVLADMVRLSPRNNLGSQMFSFRQKTDQLVSAIAIPETSTQVHLVIGREPNLLRILSLPIDQIPLEPANGFGKYVTELIIALGLDSSLELTSQERLLAAYA
ncbi:MAG: DNA topoisomerase (ATP-hydrolyzing) [Pseudanabaenaceae cyanobacterium bins.68]|nr:DNA topoisomerase (ATP-hydrolyzing) [Pseudanabaenaceae cyanobacterium bins.68]